MNQCRIARAENRSRNPASTDARARLFHGSRIRSNGASGPSARATNGNTTCTSSADIGNSFHVRLCFTGAHRISRFSRSTSLTRSRRTLSGRIPDNTNTRANASASARRGRSRHAKNRATSACTGNSRARMGTGSGFTRSAGFSRNAPASTATSSTPRNAHSAPLNRRAEYRPLSRSTTPCTSLADTSAARRSSNRAHCRPIIRTDSPQYFSAPRVSPLSCCLLRYTAAHCPSDTSGLAATSSGPTLSPWSASARRNLATASLDVLSDRQRSRPCTCART